MCDVTTALDRPRARLTDVSSSLRDFVITTYDVACDRLASFLPPGLEVERVTIEGRERALVSAVSFLNTRFYVHFAPFVKLECGQTNYRAYVRRKNGERAVWFFGTSLGSPFVMLPRHAWRLPWHRMHLTRSSRWEGERLGSLSWHARAEGAEERLELEGTGRALGVLAGFDTAEDTHAILTHPLVGFLRRRDRKLVTYGVWHAPLVMEEAKVREARFELFERLELVTRSQAPHSVLVQRATDFLVRLPPRPADHLDDQREAAPQ